ncbi:MAG TPA: N-acetyltransferase, partial [Arcobacter sp.]|nr:N-acetyltransferase [Arcobacter sp.]
MKIKEKNNKIYFNHEDKSFANITINKINKSVYLELIKVLPEFRNNHLASIMMKEVIIYLKKLG